MIPINTTLQTKNYLLRIPNETDIDFVFSATRFPNFNDGMQWEAPIHKEELFENLVQTIKHWQEGKEYSFTIVLKENPITSVGRISIRKTEDKKVLAIGYWTHPSYQKRRIMTEAVKAVLSFGFSTLQANSITAKYAIWNKASEKVLVNNGFLFIKHLEQGFKKNGQWVKENKFCLTKKQWHEEKKVIASCNFCSELKDNKHTIFENKELVILLDFDPISLGHVLILPKNHYTDFHNLPDDLLTKMMLLAKKYIQVLQTLFSNKGYSMMLNAGEFNDLKHCHLHIFPRNTAEEFSWTYEEAHLHEDASRFEVLKKLLDGYL